MRSVIAQMYTTAHSADNLATTACIYIRGVPPQSASLLILQSTSLLIPHRKTQSKKVSQIDHNILSHKINSESPSTFKMSGRCQHKQELHCSYESPFCCECRIEITDRLDLSYYLLVANEKLY